MVGVLYVLVNAAVQYVLPASAVGATQRPASDAMALVLGPVGAGIVSAGMALSTLPLVSPIDAAALLWKSTMATQSANPAVGGKLPPLSHGRRPLWTRLSGRRVD